MCLGIKSGEWSGCVTINLYITHYISKVCSVPEDACSDQHGHGHSECGCGLCQRGAVEDAQTGHGHQLPQVLLLHHHAPQHSKAPCLGVQTNTPVYTYNGLTTGALHFQSLYLCLT